MLFDDYQKEAARTIGVDDTRMMALGIAGEAGEVVELVKKDHYHGKDYDRGKMLKELGDILWYVAGMVTLHGEDLSYVAQLNIDKLRARYPAGFVPGGGNRDD